MPDVIYLGPSDNLFLKEGGKEYHPGDTIRLSAEALGNLTRTGLRFAHAHSEAEAAVIEAQVHPPVYQAPVELVPVGTDHEPSVVNLAPDPEPDPVPATHAARSPKKDGD